MYKKLKFYFFKRKKKSEFKIIGRLINEIIYTEKWDLADGTVREKILNEILAKKKSSNLLDVYLTSNYTLSNHRYLDDCDIAEIFNKQNIIALEIYKSNDIKLLHSYLDSQALEMDKNLVETRQYLEEGKNAFLEDEYSFKGAVYNLEKTKKGPATAQESNTLKTVTDRLLENEIKQQNLSIQKKELDGEIEELQKLNNMSKTEAIQALEESISRDSKLIEELEKKLKSGNVA